MNFVGASLDLGQAEVANLVIKNLGDTPLTPVEGQFYYDTRTKAAYYFNGVSWVSMSGGSSGGTGLSYSRDILPTDWVSNSGRYYCDITHNLGILDFITQFYLPATGETVQMDDVEVDNLNVLRVWSATNTEKVRITVIRISANRFSSIVTSWQGTVGAYYADVLHNLNTLDVVVSTYTIGDGKEVGMDEVVRTDPNTVRIYSATNNENIKVLIVPAA